MMAHFRLELNGREVEITARGTATLLDVLRDKFGLLGARESCGLGLCGTCTVLVDGEPVSSCLMFAVLAEGAKVTTIEGTTEDSMASNGSLHPVQQAFIDEVALQCGYCTPGMIMMAIKLLEEHPQPTVDQIKDYMAGNICRCSSYPQIIKAIQSAGARLASSAGRDTALVGDQP